MRLDYQHSSLAIVGGWNPNIITPQWFASNFRDTIFIKKIISNKSDKLEIKFDIDADPAYSVISSPITIHLAGIKVRFNHARLDLILTDNDDFSLLEEFAEILCDLQPNIPIKEYGVNLLFIEDVSAQSIIDMMISGGISKHRHFTNSPSIERYIARVDLDNINTNIDITVDHKQKACFFNLNFHFKVGSITDFIQCMSKNRIDTLQSIATRVITDIYGLRVEE
jgi:hypothetical protein